MAAGAGVGIDALADLILSQLFGRPVMMQLLIPYSEGSLVHAISEIGDVPKTEYQNDNIYLCKLFSRLLQKIRHCYNSWNLTAFNTNPHTQKYPAMVETTGWVFIFPFPFAIFYAGICTSSAAI